MVVVRIELWPGGDREKASPLGVVFIANDATGNEAWGAYDVTLSHAGKFFGRRGAYRRGRVEGFRRTLSPYHLVARALAACGIPVPRKRAK